MLSARTHTPRSTYRDNFTARSQGIASVATSRLSTSRRAKLEKMHLAASGDREKKRDKLKGVLKEKLVAKYGTIWRDMVEREVDAFIAKTMTRRIHENDLAGLENVIRRKTQTTQPSARGVGSRAGTARPSARATARSTARPETTRPSQRTGRREAPTQKVDDWTLLDAYDALNNEETVKSKRARERAVQMQLKRELDEQVAHRKAIEDRQRKEEVKYYGSIVDEVADYHREEKAKAAARHKVVMRMAEERQMQIQQERERKQKMKEQRMKYEINLLNTAAKEIERDQRRIRRAKRIQMKHAAIVQRQNEALLVERRKQKELDAEEDRQLMREFAAREKKKEADRKAFFEATAEKQRKRAAQNEESRTDEFAKIREMELRLLREQAERDRLAAKKERDSQAKRRAALQERNRILKQQVDAKRKARNDQRQKDAQFVKTFKADADAFAAEQRRKQIEAHRKKKMYRKMLNDQQAVGREGVQLMTEHERQLNKEKLSKIKNNPELLMKLQNRVMKGSAKKKKQLVLSDDEEDNL